MSSRPKSSKRDSRSWPRIAAVYAVAIVPPQLLGGALGWSVPVIAIIAIVAAIIVVATSSEFPKPIALDAAVSGAWLWTVVQRLPLPITLLEFVSPARLEVLRTSSLVGSEPRWLPLTLDPGRTEEQIVVGSAIVAAYIVGRVVAAMEGRRVVIHAVVASTALMALVGFGHEVAAANRVFGLHTPQTTAPQLLAPLLNNNHLGGYLAFGVPLAIGLALGERQPERRNLAIILATLCGSGALVASSRGAVLSLVIGLGLVGSVAFRTAADRRKQLSWIIAVAGLILGVGSYFGLGPLLQEFENGDYTKLELAARSLELVAAFPVAGVGRGSFAAAFARLEESSAWATTPENIAVVWASEWGLIAFALMVWVLVPVVVRASRSEKIEVACAAMAVTALVVHDLVDFVLEMPGVVVVATLVLASLAPRSSLHDSRRFFFATLVVVSAACAILAPHTPAARPEAMIDELRRTEDVDEVAQRVAALHPLDPALVLWVGHAYSKRGNLRSFQWFNRAMSLSPEWPSAHVLAADGLLRLGSVRQALLEIREAELRMPGSARDVACRALGRASPELVIELAPSPAHRYVDSLAGCEAATGLDAHALNSDIESVGIHIREGRRAVRENDLARAYSHARRAREIAPDDEKPLILLAEITWREEGAREGLEILSQVQSPSAQALRLQARLATNANDEPAKNQALESLRRLAAGSPTALANVWAFEGRLEEEQGNLGRSLQAFERSNQLNPNNSKYLSSIARVAAAAGQTSRARAAWRRLCEGGNEGACRRLESIGSRRQRNPLER